MPDAWQGPPASDKPLSVLKEGIASRVGHGEPMANRVLYPKRQCGLRER